MLPKKVPSAAGAPKVSTSMTLAQNVGVEAANEATGPSHHHHRQGSCLGFRGILPVGGKMSK